MSSQAIIEKEKLDNFEYSLPTCESLTFLSAAAIVLLVMTVNTYWPGNGCLRTSTVL